nr:dockerin type I repeat-containing protein [Ruminococcus intestinalis]
MNGKVDVNDVTLIMKYNVDLINLSSEQLKFADVNEDDYVDILDATLLQQYIANCVS